MNLEFYLTTRCMMGCTFCGAWYLDGHKESIPFEKVCQILRETRNRGYLYVTFSGGEPLMHDRLADIVDYAANLGFYVSISTNGLLINERFLDRLVSKVVNIRVSLHTLRRELHQQITGTDSLPRVLDAIRLMRDRRQYFSIGSTIFESNIDEIESLATFALDNKAAFIRYTPVFNIHHGSDMRLGEEFYERMLRNILRAALQNIKFLDYARRPNPFINDYVDILATRRCSAASKLYTAVAADLSIVPCPVIAPDSDLPAARYESINDLEQFQRDFNEHVFSESLADHLKGRCAECLFKSACQGGCAATKLAAGLSIEDEQPICIWHVLKRILPDFDPKAVTELLYYWQYHQSQRSIGHESARSCIRKLPIWELNYRYGYQPPYRAAGDSV